MLFPIERDGWVGREVGGDRPLDKSGGVAWKVEGETDGLGHSNSSQWLA